jgi:transcriptional regulator with XRE-family HTH domain
MVNLVKLVSDRYQSDGLGRRTSAPLLQAVDSPEQRKPQRIPRHHTQCMPAAYRAFDWATRLATRQILDVGNEFRERRLQLGESQAHVASSCRMSRVHYGRIENGRVSTLSLLEINRIAATLGLSPSIRLFPSGAPIRDAGHSKRLGNLLANVAPPLAFRLEVPLPAREDRTELRAWDAVLFGNGARTAIELEMRLRDVQAVIRRIDLKRRDDPTDSFLLLIADTRTNRLVLAEFASLFAGLPRLRPTVVRAAIASGSHPTTGLLLV